MPLLDRLGKSRAKKTPVQDIALHLERLLNTRQSTVPQDPLMGVGRLPVLGLYADPELMEQLAGVLLQQIRRYEPRLLQPTFKLQQEQLLLNAALPDGQPVQLLFRLNDNNLLQVLPRSSSGQEALTHV
ncbi:MAG: GPW/gp25 family protein [Marinospirillum sp.]|uniref:GPW/gp25 family protein n=1 Tax=Marinospirillum sp. TaxID=2183934 RepID=UPI0019FF9BA3|nr:GPW/gp25 family protein [Marinospirillum sp.]MBE0506341.1 GPW/gp25 family protein [Marinospirillum sp.]